MFTGQPLLHPAYDGCTCPCHWNAGVMHCVPCCYPKGTGLTKREMIEALSDEDRADLAVLRMRLFRGEVSAEAPFEGMDKPWTEEDKERLKTALADIFGWGKKT